MGGSILRTSGSVVLLLFYAWAMFPSPPDSTELADDVRELAEQSRALFQAGRYEEALAPALTLHGAHPANLVYLRDLAMIYKALGRSRDEADAWERFVAASPTPQEACPHLGDAYSTLGLVARVMRAST